MWLVVATLRKTQSDPPVFLTMAPKKHLNHFKKTLWGCCAQVLQYHKVYLFFTLHLYFFVICVLITVTNEVVLPQILRWKIKESLLHKKVQFFQCKQKCDSFCSVLKMCFVLSEAKKNEVKPLLHK